jgi:hypothetical protein
MKLTYRGIRYDYTPATVDSDETSMTVQYRGSSFKVRQLATPLAKQPSMAAIYRGVHYSAQPMAIAESEAIRPAVDAAPVAVAAAPAPAQVQTGDRIRQLMINHHHAIKQREQSVLVRFATEIGLDADYAAHYWNPIQGKINPALAENYDRNSVAFS